MPIETSSCFAEIDYREFDCTLEVTGLLEDLDQALREKVSAARNWMAAMTVLESLLKQVDDETEDLRAEGRTPLHAITQYNVLLSLVEEMDWHGAHCTCDAERRTRFTQALTQALSAAFAWWAPPSDRRHVGPLLRAPLKPDDVLDLLDLTEGSVYAVWLTREGASLSIQAGLKTGWNLPEAEKRSITLQALDEAGYRMALRRLWDRADSR